MSITKLTRTLRRKCGNLTVEIDPHRLALHLPRKPSVSISIIDLWNRLVHEEKAKKQTHEDDCVRKYRQRMGAKFRKMKNSGLSWHKIVKALEGTRQQIGPKPCPYDPPWDWQACYECWHEEISRLAAEENRQKLAQENRRRS